MTDEQKAILEKLQNSIPFKEFSEKYDNPAVVLFEDMGEHRGQRPAYKVYFEGTPKTPKQMRESWLIPLPNAPENVEWSQES